MGSKTATTLRRIVAVGLAPVTGGLSLAAEYQYEKKQKEAQKAKTLAQASYSAAEETGRQAQISARTAEDERLRRLRLLQYGSRNTFEQSTGRKTLLGQ